MSHQVFSKESLRVVPCPKCGHGYDIASESRCLKGLLGGDSQVARCTVCDNYFRFTLQGRAVGILNPAGQELYARMLERKSMSWWMGSIFLGRS